MPNFGYRFINEMIQRWQDRPWIKFDVSTPYHLGHRRERGHLPFVGQYHFKRYCKFGHTRWQSYKHSKMKKLYWRLHPEYKKHH